jgi:hypothetical protein
MRSELVYKVLAYEPNRYQLVRLLAKGTRKMHKPSTRLQETTNKVLEQFIDLVPQAAAKNKVESDWMERRRAA